jgi:Protein of unknown function (DUF5132)
MCSGSGCAWHYDRITSRLSWSGWCPALTRWGRPAVKGAIKQGVVAYAVLRERASEMGETMSDLLAEAQVELATESTGETDSETIASE